jgi:cytidylate kinase
MTVIATTRELGALGSDVAARVAGELGLDVVHDDLIEQHLSRQLQLDIELLRRYLEGEASLWERWRIDRRRVSHFTAAQILALAQKGNVLIRGWGAPQLLRDVGHVICIRVCAPMAFRIDVVKRRLKLADDDAAEREIERSDEAHERAVRAVVDANWRDATSYALVLNTGKMSVETAAELVLQLARTPRFAETAESRQRLADTLLVARVREALGERGIPDMGLDLRAEDGVVTVQGALVANENIGHILDIVREVEGVRAVQDEVQVVPFGYGA